MSPPLRFYVARGRDNRPRPAAFAELSRRPAAISTAIYSIFPKSRGTGPRRQAGVIADGAAKRRYSHRFAKIQRSAVRRSDDDDRFWRWRNDAAAADGARRQGRAACLAGGASGGSA